MRKYKTGLFFILFLTGLSVLSCRYFQPRKEEHKAHALARVYDAYLYPQDLNGMGLSNLSSDDSMKLANELINQWVNQKLLLHYAKDNLGRKVNELEKQVDDYRQSLIIYTYQSHYIDNNLDTLVSSETAKQWYSEHLDNFILDHNIYRIRFVILQSGETRNDSLDQWLKSSNPDDIDRLQIYTLRHAVNSNLNDSLWYDEISLKKYFTPDLITKLNKQNPVFISSNDSLFNYNVHLSERKIKGENAPFSYVRKKVIKTILNKRKLDMLDKLTDRILRDAASNNNYKIYIQEK